MKIRIKKLNGRENSFAFMHIYYLVNGVEFYVANEIHVAMASNTFDVISYSSVI